MRVINIDKGRARPFRGDHADRRVYRQTVNVWDWSDWFAVGVVVVGIVTWLALVGGEPWGL